MIIGRTSCCGAGPSKAPYCLGMTSVGDMIAGGGVHMRFCACSGLVGKRIVCGAIVLLAASGAPVLARDAAAVPESQVPANPADSAQSSSADSPRVFLAQPVGLVSAGRAADGAGRTMFAARNQVAGSASVVSFSRTPPPGPALAALSLTAAAPVARATLTSAFGAARPSANGGLRAHAGVDLAAPLGSPVTAAMPGRVSKAGWSGGYGLLVVVQHGNGLETRYGHLSSIRVTPGQLVAQGQLVGLVGSTGRSTGPHLHYEIRRDGRALNPLAR
jgi:murein DD-endopeptidase MepM/ murein hydrolase activator NlpD